MTQLQISAIESTQLIGEFLNMVNVKYSKILAT